MKLKVWLKAKLKYILGLAVLWAFPLTWIVGMYLYTVPADCRPNMTAWWYCFWFGYLLPPIAWAPIGIFVILASAYLIKKILEKKE